MYWKTNSGQWAELRALKERKKGENIAGSVVVASFFPKNQVNLRRRDYASCL